MRSIRLPSAVVLALIAWSSWALASSSDWDDQHTDYEPTYTLKRQANLNRNSVRFGYQNPIPEAPTLPPDSVDQEDASLSDEGSLIDRRQTKSWQRVSGCPPGLVQGRNDCVPDLSWLQNAFGSDEKWSWTDSPVPTAQSTLRTTRRPKELPTVPPYTTVRSLPTTRVTYSPRPTVPSHGHSTSAQTWTQRTTRKWTWTGQTRTTSKIVSATTPRESSVDTSISNPCESLSPKYRIHSKTKECLPIGTVEECGTEKNMAFYPKDKREGECDCLRNTTRPLVYHPKTDTCYFVYQQAYCAELHWLRINDDGIPACVNNPCWSYGEEMFKWDWMKNSDIPYMNLQGIVPVYEIQMCVPLGHNCLRHENGTLLFPRKNPSALPEKVLGFSRGHVEPECIPLSQRAEDKFEYQDCIPGSKKHVAGDCNIERNG